MLYDSLLLLQHRGQDAAGIATELGKNFSMHKGSGLVRDVFRTRNMRDLGRQLGHRAGALSDRRVGGQCAGGAAVLRQRAVRHHARAQRQPDQLDAAEGRDVRIDRRHINTESDSEVLLNVLAHELQMATAGYSLDPSAVFKAVSGLHRRVRGSYAVVSQIAGYGVLAFRDPFGIRPLVLGQADTDDGPEYLVASESVALQGLGYRLVRDVAPGEAIFIDLDGGLHTKQCAEHPQLHPCIFEYVYLARPDSVMDGISVYAARLRMGETLAEKIRRELPLGDIDVVMPIPDSSRPAAMQMALRLGLEYREGFIKNRYVGRTFIMPGQGVRKKSVRQKLNPIGVEFKGKNVLIVDDSIVRGTTSNQIVEMARESGANKVIFASAAPPVRYPNVYGIDMPTRDELIASGRDDEQIRAAIGADVLIYQDIDDMKRAINEPGSGISRFEASCFDGDYITGDVSSAYLDRLEYSRLNPSPDEVVSRSQLNLNLALES